MPIDTTSVWIVEAPTWEYATPTPISNAVYNTPMSAAVPLDNFAGSMMLLSGVLVDVNGNESNDADAPLREMFVFGGQGTRTVTANDTMLPTDGLILVDTSSLTAPDPTTLAADIPDGLAGDLIQLHLVDGSATVYNTDVVVGAERLRIQDGAGTNDPMAIRGAAGSTIGAHASGDTVIVPAVLIFKLLPSSEVPNVMLIVDKISTDANAVDVQAGGTEPDQDTYPDGSFDYILSDTSQESGSLTIVFPGK